METESKEEKFGYLLESFLPTKLKTLAKIFENVFRESLVIELIWENKIEYKIDNRLAENNFQKISFWKILKKYLSKRLRSAFK